ncbi:MAG: hypothetical protein JSS91_06210 [Bacteroidetes bacterium]|nr:hypothetical protein [Bacteroidota bacterium]
MKKFITITSVFIIFFAAVSNSFSQANNVKVYIAGGYNFNFPKASSVNFIINRYNQTRSNLTKTMDNVNSMSGLTLALGGILESYNSSVLLEGGVTFKNSGEKKAEGVFSGNDVRRDFKVSSTLVNVGMGYMLNSNNPVDFGLGLFVDFGSVKYKTRVYTAGETVPDYTDIETGSSTLSLGFTPTAFLNVYPVDNFGVSVRPYYFAQIFTQDLEEVNKTLNPNTWMNDDPESYNKETLSGFGVDVKAMIIF